MALLSTVSVLTIEAEAAGYRRTRGPSRRPFNIAQNLLASASLLFGGLRGGDGLLPIGLLRRCGGSLSAFLCAILWPLALRFRKGFSWLPHLPKPAAKAHRRSRQTAP